jgi:SAM-dependent methyltransferase
MSHAAGGDMHPLVGGFTDAAAYDAARPRYDERVARQLASHLQLAPGAPVLELGAGTGQLSEALLAAGLDLTAVEPLGATRELLQAAIGAERVRAGRAEEIPLGAASVDAVFAADAFHWFDEQRAMPEIKRVLRPRGGVAILRMAPHFDEPWSREVGELLVETRPEHPAFGERGAAAALEEDPAFGPVQELALTMPAAVDRAGLLARLASFSWIATLAERERERLIERIAALLDRHGVERLEYENRVLVWTARLIEQGAGAQAAG